MVDVAGAAEQESVEVTGSDGVAVTGSDEVGAAVVVSGVEVEETGEAVDVAGVVVPPQLAGIHWPMALRTSQSSVLDG